MNPQGQRFLRFPSIGRVDRRSSSVQGTRDLPWDRSQHGSCLLSVVRGGRSTIGRIAWSIFICPISPARIAISQHVDVGQVETVRFALIRGLAHQNPDP